MRSVVLLMAGALLLQGCSMGGLSAGNGFGAAPSEAALDTAGDVPLSLAAASGSSPRKRAQTVAGSDGLQPLTTAGTEAPARLDPASALDVINRYRKSKGLKTLTLDPQLTLAAKAHARDLAKHDRISHYGSDGSSPWDRVKRSGYPVRLAAENVGTGQTSLEEVIAGWKASEGHNKNLLLADATHMGIGLVQDGRTEFKTFWTLVVGAPL